MTKLVQVMACCRQATRQYLSKRIRHYATTSETRKTHPVFRFHETFMHSLL